MNHKGQFVNSGNRTYRVNILWIWFHFVVFNFYKGRGALSALPYHSYYKLELYYVTPSWTSTQAINRCGAVTFIECAELFCKYNAIKNSEMFKVNMSNSIKY